MVIYMYVLCVAEEQNENTASVLNIAKALPREKKFRKIERRTFVWRNAL